MTGASSLADRIRPARPADIDAMIGIERAAGEMFRTIGMSEVADDDPGDPAESVDLRRRRPGVGRPNGTVRAWAT